MLKVLQTRLRSLRPKLRIYKRLWYTISIYVITNLFIGVIFGLLLLVLFN